MKMKKIHLITTGLLLLIFIAVTSVSALTLSSISPNTANSGTTGIFDVYGSGFQSGFGVTQVMLRNNVYGDIGATGETFVSSHHIRATIAIEPGARPGYYTLWAQNNRDGTVVELANAFYVNAASITVTSPNGGENWQVGSNHYITWNSGDTNVRIQLMKGYGNNVVQTITPNYPPVIGGFLWTVPSVTPGTDYKVKVTSLRYPTESDMTDGWFTIASPPSITVTSPNGGETWNRGSSHRITWSYTGSPGSMVKIVLLKGSTELLKGGTIVDSVPIGSRGKGSYTWPISSFESTGTDYKISIQSINQPSIKDTSDNYFTITSRRWWSGS